MRKEEKVKRTLTILLTTVVLSLVISGSSVAFAENQLDQKPTYDRQMPFRSEGIPLPLIDVLEDGFFQYLGDGGFITDTGRTFFWNGDHFVNSDGTDMDLPSSSRAHLNSLGIMHQPNASDLERAAEMRAETMSQKGLKENMLKAPASSSRGYSAWSGRYLHVGQFYTTFTGVAGDKANITVFDRSPGFAEYYGIGLGTVGYSQSWGVGLQFCDVEGTNTLGFLMCML